MPARTDNDSDAMVVALMALAWVLGDDRRARRLLDLTGLDPERLRGAVDDPATLGAVLAFLASHEPDLLACAEAIGLPPSMLTAAHEELTG